MRYLAASPRRLVPKDELFAAVWPGLTVTDDALVQSIGELRRALGKEGAHLIKTVPVAATDLKRASRSRVRQINVPYRFGRRMEIWISRRKQFPTGASWQRGSRRPAAACGAAPY